jgi:alkanesulfonate monooxygenase SsuD/methylene tetrahydromethanopterin reductase-like flavin-dependent oxidoreductase (luciferase family)
MSNTKLPLAVMLMPLENRRDAIMELALTAERQGYEALFLPETWALDVTVLLAEIAARTSKLKIGSGILSVWGRSSGTIAMAAATLQTISGGRFLLGLGSSTKQLAEGLHDVEYRAPYEKLRRTITQVRSLLQGGRIPLSESAQARPLKLNLSGYEDIPILLGASSHKSIQMAGELCDGWLPFLYPRDQLQDGIGHMQAAAARAGRSKEDFLITPVIPTIVARSTGRAREGAAWVVSFYINLMGPLYRNALIRFGYKNEIESIMEANQGQKSALVPSRAEVLLDQLTLNGTPDEVREKIPAWLENGATMPCLMLNPNLSLDEINYSVSAMQETQ